MFCRDQPIYIAGGYARGGIDSPGANELFTEMHRATHGGTLPFLLLADFNATPQELTASKWAEILKATVVCCGEVTSTAREIDFALVSTEIAHLILACIARWDSPYATHATIGVILSRDRADYMQWTPRAPAKIPKVDASTLASEATPGLWNQLT